MMPIKQPTADNFFNTSDNAWIYFEDYNSNGIRPIILLHGFQCTSRFFWNNIDGLTEKGNRLILIDWRAHGAASNVTHGLTMQRAAQDIKELLDHLQIEDACLMGWSMGSSVVLDYYEQFGFLHLSGLGIIDSLLYPYSSESWNPHSQRAFNYGKLGETIQACMENRIEWSKNFVRACFEEGTTIDSELLDYLANQTRQIPVWCAYGLYGDFLLRDYTKTLQKLDIPCLIMGANSPINPGGIGAAEYYNGLVKSLHLLKRFDHGGHVMFYQYPEEFNETVLSFVNVTIPRQ